MIAMRLIDSNTQIDPPNTNKKELSMIASNMGAVAAEFPQKRDGIADGGAQGPMSQQDASGSHGYEMHPQKFVRLVGCHDLNAAKHQAANHLH
jgi:hypothetical protein